jgi:glycosyltransferase involved in cell wall biosynthesis
MSLKRKTILMIIPGLGRGGAERIFYLMSKELSKNFNVVECFFNLNDQVYPISANEHYILNPTPARNFFEKFVNLYKRIRGLRAIKRKVNPDFSISHLDGADYINVFTKRQSEKVISCVQCTLVNDVSIKGLPGWIRKHFFIRFFYRWTDAIVTVSNELQLELQQFCGIPAGRFKTIYNFADVDEVTAASKQDIDNVLDRALTENFSLINSGRMEEQKNQEFLLQVFHGLSQRKHNSKLFILGDGQLRTQLIQYAVSLGLNVYTIWDGIPANEHHNVFFMGFEKNPFKYFAKAKWFVFTSRWEGLPLVLVESMACNTPIISTDCKTGPREILSDRIEPVTFTEAPLMAEYGILMPDEKAADEQNQLALWINTLQKLAENQNLREMYISKQSQRLQLFSIQFAIESWKKLFEKLSGK